MQQATGAATAAHPDDAPALPVPVSQPVGHGDTIAIGDAALSVIHLRGHTPGSIALCYDGGGAAGRPAAPVHRRLAVPRRAGQHRGRPGALRQLITDLEQRVFAELPDGTWVYPGHGADTTLGTERPHVPEWRARGW